ncbi:MAG: D-glycero-beta-D-manno-heptose 1-phosphate adenylyltransferase [Candidatus Edwardsbacteria bacterium]
MGKIITLPDLIPLRNQAKKEQKKVVFTNGVFDILHRGHIEYLQKAKRLGDILIVGLNSDASTKRIKGEKRPIVPQEDRAVILSALACVDYVCLFDEDTPLKLIEAILPDILVKGADWKVEEIVGKEIVERAGGKVVQIDFLEGKSTSGLINRILRTQGKDSK